uniref:Intercellular adhesion molecule N-terminal domain-containing protein n=1 Tax=Varanus komodoensis TaxID=61221 RepID=A0A8D2JHV7_VARKO
MEQCPGWGGQSPSPLLLFPAHLCSSFPLAVHPCKVTIHPQELAVEFGGPVILNCTSSCANHDKMDWEVSLQGLKEEGKGWISLNVASVTEWNFQPLCLVKNAGPETLKKARVYVYRFLEQGLSANIKGHGAYRKGDVPSAILVPSHLGLYRLTPARIS